MASGKLNRLAVRENNPFRFAMNTLHVYTDARKKALAASLATAIAGWWTGGAGIPVISNMIMCSWAWANHCWTQRAFERRRGAFLQDTVGMETRYRSRRGRGNWRDRRGNKFGYEDYLRLFLLFVDPDTKMDRVQDLICLNLYGEGREWRLMNTTHVSGGGAISVNYLFIPRLDIAGETRHWQQEGIQLYSL